MLWRRAYLRMRATTSMEQERSWAIWGKVEVMCMLRKSCKTGLRCWNAYLGWRELPAVTGQLGLEGPEANLRNRCWRANTTWGKVNLSRNQLFTNGKWLAVQLPDDLQAEAAFGEGSKICGPKQNYFFRLVVQFSEKTQVSLICWGWRLLMSQNFSKWCIIYHDPNSGDFLGRKFPSFSMEGSGRK